MDRVPGARGYRKEIGAGVKGRKFVGPLIVADLILKALNATYSGSVVFLPQSNHGLADGISVFIQHPAVQNRRRGKLQDKVFSIHASARDDRGRELFMLVVVGADIPAFGASQRVLAGGHVELKISVVGSKQGLRVLGILHISQEDAGLRK